MARASDHVTQVSVKKTAPNADYEETKEVGGAVDGSRKMKTSFGVRKKEDEALSGSFAVASTQVSHKA